jgi:hypothetical protein
MHSAQQGGTGPHAVKQEQRRTSGAGKAQRLSAAGPGWADSGEQNTAAWAGSGHHAAGS